MAQDVTSENFQTEVLDSPVPVLVDFYAEWCGPCRVLTPTLTELAEQADGKYKVVKVNSDVSGDLCKKYGINALPTLIVFKGGEQAAKLVGVQDKSRLVEALGS